jgi:hypothetical protein
MRAQSWILNLVAAVIATSATIIATAQEPQKQSLEKPAESAQGNQQESKKKEEVIVCRFVDVFTTIDVLVTDGANRPITDLSRDDFAIFEDAMALSEIFA